MTAPARRKSDLGVRVASAVVMVAVAGTALWLGGWLFAIFVTIVAIGVFWEWWHLILCFDIGPLGRGLWIAGGLGYVFLAGVTLIALRRESLSEPILVLMLVIAVDVGAYFAGRTIGGPKIAPRISPSKTWAGLGGGILAAALANVAWSLRLDATYPDAALADVAFPSLIVGLFVAVIAQLGDFFESWMKRRAGVKDSGRLLPGHGGLFDRVDGLLAVLFVISIPLMADTLR